MNDDTYSIIEKIINTYSEDEWEDQCKAQLPDADWGDVVATIEIICGGDLQEIA